ncbi:MAG: SPOR domain-containing protein [Chitinophagales bacterium]
MKYLIVALFTFFSVFSNAQNSISISDKVILNSSVNLERTIDLHKQKNGQTDDVAGYRIQITSNNDRTKIYNLRSAVYQQFPDIKNYLKYEQPYYRLRIGDFKSRLEARKYLEKVIQYFPSAFIVTDEVKVR